MFGLNRWKTGKSSRAWKDIFDLGKLLTVWLMVMVFASIMLFDYKIIPGADFIRVGKLRFIAAGAAPLIFAYFRRYNPFLAFFTAYAWLYFVLSFMQLYAVLDVCMLLAAFAMAVGLHRNVRGENILRLIGVCAVLQALYGIAQTLGYEKLFAMRKEFLYIPTGTMGNATILGVLTAIGACFWFARAHGARDWRFKLFILCAAVTILTDSTMSILSMLGGLFYLIWRQSWKGACIIAFGAIFLGVCAYLYNPDHTFFSFTGRLNIWPHGVNAWRQAPWFGHGPGSWLGMYFIRTPQALYSRWGIPGNQIWGQLHNEYLQVLVEYGLLGFLTMMAGLAALFFRSLFKAPVYGSILMVLAVNSFGNFPMHIASYGIIAAWLAVAIWDPVDHE